MEWKTEYIRLLDSMNADVSNIAGLLSNHVPAKLYKYISLDNSYWRDVIFDGNIYLPEPKELNDPYDCMPKLDLKLVAGSQKVQEALINRKLNISASMIKDTLEKNQWLENEVINDIRKNIRIGCFSTKHDLMLMWSHYANNHKGVCIEIETESINSAITNKLFPVLYSDERKDITVDICSGSGSAGLKAFIYKSNDWSYEEEWRYITLNSAQYRHNKKFLKIKNHISTIFIGAECNDADRNEINNWGKANNVITKQMKLSEYRYKLFSV